MPSQVIQSDLSLGMKRFFPAYPGKDFDQPCGLVRELVQPPDAAAQARIN